VIAIGSSVAKGNEEIQTVEVPLFDFTTVLLAIFSIGIGLWFVKSGQGTLSRRGYLDPAITPTLAVMLCGMMFIFAGLGAWWGSGHGDDGTMQKTAWIYGSAAVAQIPILLMYSKLHRKSYSRHILPISCIAFAVFVPIALTIAAIGHALLVTVGIEAHSNLGHETLKQLANAPWGSATWVVVVCATLGAGVFEEIMYRGLILPAFSSMFGGKTFWRATIATSGFFALMHIGAAQPSAIAGLFVLSIGLCWARVKSGGVIAPIVIHVVFNTMNIAFVYSTHL
jgi:membrane protease YdiL (CAAX protease family)